MSCFRLLSLCSFLYLAVVGSYALASDLETWHAALPNTQMPASLLKILQPSGKPVESKTLILRIGEKGLNLNKKQGSAFPTVGKESYATNEKLIVVPDFTTFFLEQDLRSGKKMKLYFPKTTSQAKFLPRQVSDSIPFSTEKLPEILNRFSVKPESAEAKIMKETIEDCKRPRLRGEAKYCATSLQSLIDFSVSKIGKEVEVYTTEVEKEAKMDFVIGENGVKKIGERSVVCHKQNYVYAVFYCHQVHATKAYAVSLVAADGTKAKAVAVCHTDTRFWSAQQFAFQVLKVKPGTVPVCHFLPNDSLVWVPK